MAEAVKFEDELVVEEGGWGTRLISAAALFLVVAFAAAAVWYFVFREEETTTRATEDIPVALEPFRQVDSLLTRKYEGTGLGLPLATSIVEHHGGSLRIQSAPGKGTTVFVTLPRERSVAHRRTLPAPL